MNTHDNYYEHIFEEEYKKNVSLNSTLSESEFVSKILMMNSDILDIIKWIDPDNEAELEFITNAKEKIAEVVNSHGVKFKYLASETYSKIINVKTPFEEKCTTPIPVGIEIDKACEIALNIMIPGWNFVQIDGMFVPVLELKLYPDFTDLTTISEKVDVLVHKLDLFLKVYKKEKVTPEEFEEIFSLDYLKQIRMLYDGILKDIKNEMLNNKDGDFRKSLLNDFDITTINPF